MAEKRRRPKGPVDDGMVMERLMTDELRAIKLHQAFSDDLDHLYATDTMAIGADKLRGTRKPILIQLTKSIGATRKISRWLRRSAHGPEGTRLYVEMRGRVTRRMAHALKRACLEIWSGQRNGRKFFGVTINSNGKTIWWNPWFVVKQGRRTKRRKNRNPHLMKFLFYFFGRRTIPHRAESGECLPRA